MKNLSKHATIILLILTWGVSLSFAQQHRWQQRVTYTMDIDMDVDSHQFKGTQRLVYHNNSPDTLHKVYYLLQFNAFQPGSMMDIRSLNIEDPDRRVQDRISKLTPEEIGYQKVVSLKQDGKKVTTQVMGTILIVTLASPILPNTQTTFDMAFEAQVPVQIRRSGRDNKEGIAYSMTQWYPRLAEYDHQGWHAHQYVAREFHGVWGDYDVTISIDPTYVIGGTGVLTNPNEIGHGYEDSGVTVKAGTKKKRWHFVAKDVIDFAWAADPEYVHDKVKVPNGPTVHFFYQKNEKTESVWKDLQPIAVSVFTYMNKTFGKYPFEHYSVIQGGDGGMEYPMCTLIMGERSLDGVAGTMTHEIAHSWYQMALATNESLYAWMDEGFTVFSSNEAMAYAMDRDVDHKGSYRGYHYAHQKNRYEAPSTPSDHYSSNLGYSIAAYSSGALFLCHLKYLMGDKAFYNGMLRYYNTWKMRHPEPNDFIRVMEKASDMQLHWFLQYWVGTTKTIDYGIGTVTENENKTIITLNRKGELPMPVEVVITKKDGSSQRHYIPMNETLSNKPGDGEPRTDHPAWFWVEPTYELTVDVIKGQIASIQIDTNEQLADTDRSNDRVEFE